jgi:predicted alpha/beta superfamily hydrolase
MMHMRQFAALLTLALPLTAGAQRAATALQFDDSLVSARMGGVRSLVTLAQRFAVPQSLAMPRMIIVGIRSGSTRGRDMYTAPLTADDTLNTGGGRAADFLSFIDRELKPYLEDRFRTAPFYVIRGHSAAGFFVTYAVAHAPGSFQGAIASSPAVWWNDEIAARSYATSIANRSPTSC